MAGGCLAPAEFSSSAGLFSRKADLLALGVGVVDARVPGSYLDVNCPLARCGEPAAIS